MLCDKVVLHRMFARANAWVKLLAERYWNALIGRIPPQTPISMFKFPELRFLLGHWIKWTLLCIVFT